MAIYRDTISQLIDEIHQFQPDWIITKSATPDVRPPLPFFYYNIRRDYERLTFNDVESEPFSFPLQLTAVAEDPIDASDLAHDMRMLLQSWGLLEDLAKVGISIPRVESLANVETNFGVSYETESKLLVTIVANDTYDDTTQSGYIEGVDLSTQANIKEEHNE